MINICIYRDETLWELLSNKYSTVKILIIALLILGGFACLASF